MFNDQQALYTVMLDEQVECLTYDHDEVFPKKRLEFLKTFMEIFRWYVSIASESNVT